MRIWLLDDSMRKRPISSHYPVCFGLFVFLTFWSVQSSNQLQGNPRPIHQLKISGWKISGAPHSFGPQDLFEYINGAADFLIEYGFVSLEGAYYHSGTDPDDSVTVDIYDMGEKLNAFGVFQSKRSKDTPILNIGTASFGGEGYLVFYKDRYFVEINAFIKNQEWKTQPLVMARKLAKLLPGDALSPVELSYFSEQDKIKGSERYVKGGILGHGFLDRGIVCDYLIEKEVVSAFLAFLPSKKAAVKSFKQHKTFLQESGTCFVLDGLGERALISQEPYHKNIIIAQTGSFVIGVYDLSGPQKGRPILEDIVKRLPSAHP